MYFSFVNTNLLLSLQGNKAITIMTTLAHQDIYLTQKEFEKDLEICLTIIKECKGYYICEYISASFNKKLVNIFIKN